MDQQQWLSDLILPAEFPVQYDEIISKMNSIDPLRYSSTRNFVDGAVTRLSPYISRGVISCLQIAQSMYHRGFQYQDCERLLQELAWREYFQRVWQHLGDDMFNDIKQPQQDVCHQQVPAALVDSNTGIYAIDDHLRLLSSAGYIHNHMRMYTASLACNIAKSHWRLPSRWMYYHLLDGDLASNTCSWQWVAGAFSIKKYYFNQENLNKYSGSTQRGTFINVSYDDLPAMPIPGLLAPTCDITLTTDLPVTEQPSIDPAKPTLIYNSYNLDPYWKTQEEMNRVLLLEPSHFARYPVSRKVIDFILGLSTNIPGIQVYVGEVDHVAECYHRAGVDPAIISKEHPAFTHYPGTKVAREWIFPEVVNYYSSFSQFWKRCLKPTFWSA